MNNNTDNNTEKNSKPQKKPEEKPKLPIPHWVCTGGCGTVSETSAKCQIKGCWRFRNPLTECHCTNGTHGDLPTRNVPKD